MDMMNLMQQINQFKAQLNGKDPNAMLKQLMDSGQVSQAQYEEAKKKAEMLMNIFK